MSTRRFVTSMLILVVLLVLGLRKVHGEGVYARVTFYRWTGSPMFNGDYPYPGAAACSWNLPLGTRVRFPNGEVVTCADRGELYPSLYDMVIWVDVYARPDLHYAYDYTILTVEYPR